MTALLEAINVTKSFGGGLFDKTQTVALENFSFSISEENPSVTAIVGESGSGKTTAARLLLGLTSPTTGEVRYQGQNLDKLSRSEKKTFLSDVQTVFQDPFEVYNPFYKVDHVLETPIRNFKLASSKDEQRKLMCDALEAVGLRPDETLGRYPHQLSGGQRQRIMVARALLLKPRIIIADEPVSMVDASLRATILESLLVLNRDFGISLIYITHDLTTAFQISEDIIVLYRGSVAEAGDAGSGGAETGASLYEVVGWFDSDAESRPSLVGRTGPRAAGRRADADGANRSAASTNGARTRHSSASIRCRRSI